MLSGRALFLLPLALSLALAPALVSAQDVVFKTDGSKLKGKIVDEGRREVTIDTPGGRLVVPKSQIARIEREGDAQKEFEARKGKLSTTDLQGWYALGRWCQEQGLADQAVLCWKEVVRIDTDHQDARALLGFKKLDGKWLTEEEWYAARGYVKYDGRWVTPEDRDNLAAGLVLVDGRWVSKEEVAAGVEDEEPPDVPSPAREKRPEPPRAKPEPRPEPEKPAAPEKPEPADEPAPEAGKPGRKGKTVRFRVMSFNVRFDFESDGSNRWQHRADLVAKTIKDSQATLVGIQEDKADQVQDLEQRLPEFAFLGLGRNGGQSGEHNSIVYRRDKWRLLENGDFWLSDTPDVQGSNTWGDKYPRKVTWALLEPRDGADKPVLFFNTHLPEGRADHLRDKGTALMRSWLEKKVGGTKGLAKLTVLGAGDYNTDAGSQPQKNLTQEGFLRDAWIEGRASDPAPGTFGDFKGLKGDKRIDWVLIGGRGRALSASKIDEPVDGRYPSDHYPVLADIEIR